ncbi:MAG: WD40/YVTN/BNR-like repeat-containing protein [Chloroflexota bacterium]
MPDTVPTKWASFVLEGAATGWQRLDTTGGGAQKSIATHPTDPNIVYMASDNGGLFKTENGGDAWFSVSSNLGTYRLGAVTLDPLNPQTIYVAASTDHGDLTLGGATGEIYRSSDAGRVWEFVSDAMGFQNFQASLLIPYDPDDPGRFDQDGDRLSDTILVGAWSGPADPPPGGIWRSDDEGLSFTQLALHDKNTTALRAFSGDNHILFAAVYEGQVYRSRDLGTTWEDITGNLPLPHPSDLAIHPGDPDTLYVTCRWCQAGQPPVWKTVDGGQHWVASSNGLNPDKIRGFPSILIDRFDANILYVTTSGAQDENGGVYQSTDAGQNWHPMPARLVLPDGRPHFWYEFEGKFALAQAVDGRLYAGNTGGWRYPDGDPNDGVEEWEPATRGVGNVQVNTIKVDPLNPSILYQGISDFGPYKSVDRGASFYRIVGNGWPVTVDNYVWNGPYYSNYQKCQLGCSPTCQETGYLASGGTTDFAISRQSSNVIYSAFGSGSGSSEFGGVNKSIDAGETWQPVGFQLEQGFSLNPESCVPYGVRHLAIDPTDDNILLAAQEILSTQTGKLYRTTDGGTTWVEVLVTAHYITGLEISDVDPDQVVLTTFTEVFKSEEKGGAGSWQNITPPDAGWSFQAVALSPYHAGVYVLGTNDRGVYYSTDGGASWTNYGLDDLFAQKHHQGSEQFLDPEIATATNPNAYLLKNISAIVFDPTVPDTFYVAGTRWVRASFGVAKITHAGQQWQRLPLEGLSHRNIFDLAVDSQGEFLYAGTFNGTFRFNLRAQP